MSLKSPTRLLPMFPQSLWFNGVNAWVNLGTAPLLQFNSGSFSVEVWFRTPNSSDFDNELFANAASCVAGGYKLITQNGYLRGSVNSYDIATGAFTYQQCWCGASFAADNQWHHGVYVLSNLNTGSTYAYIYVDGQLRCLCGPWDTSGWYVATTANVGVAYSECYYGGCCPYYGLGYIPVVRVYNYALTTTDVWNLYTSNPNNPPTSGLVLWLHWSSVNTTSGIWYDLSGNNINGTIINAQYVWLITTPIRLLTPTRVLTV